MSEVSTQVEDRILPKTMALTPAMRPLSASRYLLPPTLHGLLGGVIAHRSAFPRSVLPCVFFQAGSLVKDSQLIVSRETIDAIAETLGGCLIGTLEEVSSLGILQEARRLRLQHVQIREQKERP